MLKNCTIKPVSARAMKDFGTFTRTVTVWDIRGDRIKLSLNRKHEPKWYNEPTDVKVLDIYE